MTVFVVINQYKITDVSDFEEQRAVRRCLTTAAGDDTKQVT